MPVTSYGPWAPISSRARRHARSNVCWSSTNTFWSPCQVTETSHEVAVPAATRSGSATTSAAQARMSSSQRVPGINTIPTRLLPTTSPVRHTQPPDPPEMIGATVSDETRVVESGAKAAIVVSRIPWKPVTRTRNPPGTSVCVGVARSGRATGRGTDVGGGTSTHPDSSAHSRIALTCFS